MSFANLHRKIALVSLSVALVSAFFAGRAQAATRYFDVNGVTTGSGVTAAGTYSWEDPIWNTAGTNDANAANGISATTTWTDGDFPRFAAGTDANGLTYTVTASSNHTIAGMQLLIGTAFTGGPTVNGGATVNVNSSGGAVLSLATGLQGAFVSTGGNLRMNGPIGGVDATSALQWSGGGGSLYLYGANTFQGGVSLNSVNGLNFNNSSAFGTGTVSWNVATQVLAVPQGGTGDATSGFSINNPMKTRSASTLIMASSTVAPVNWTGGWTLATGTSTIQTNNVGAPTGSNFTISGAIVGTDATSALTKTGVANLTLSGPNTYAGKTIIGNGALIASSLNKVSGGSASSSLGAPTTVANGTIGLGGTTNAGQLTYVGTGETTDRVLDLAGTTGGGVVDQSGSGALVFSSNMTASGGGIKTLTLQGSTAGTGEIAGNIVDNSGTNKTSVTKAGTGTWTLSGANTYTGTTTVSGGVLKMASATAVPSANPLALGGGTLNNSTGALKTITGATTLSTTSTLTENSAAETFTFNGNFTNSGGNRVLTGGNGAGTAAGTITLGGNVFLSEATGTGRTLILAGATSSTPNFAVSGTVANFNGGAGTAGSIQVGNGTNASAATLTLSGTNTYTGATNVSTASLLNIGSAGALSSSTLTMTGTGSFDNTSGATLNLTNNMTLSGGSPTFVGTNDINFGNNTVTISGANRSITTTAGNLTIGSVGQDASARNLTKAGAGTLIIVGTGTYTGSTIINGGTLKANNTSGSATGSGAVSVNATGTLGGTGTISGPVTVNAGGTISPGNSVATLNIGALTFTDATAALKYEINSTLNVNLASAADLLNANGNLTLGTGAALNLVDVGSPSNVFAGGTKFTMISYSGTWDGGTFTGAADDSIVSVGLNQYVINYNDTTGGSNFGGGSYTNYVTLTAVPEAGQLLLGSVVCLALGVVFAGRKLNAKRPVA